MYILLSSVVIALVLSLTALLVVTYIKKIRMSRKSKSSPVKIELSELKSLFSRHGFVEQPTPLLVYKRDNMLFLYSGSGVLYLSVVDETFFTIEEFDKDDIKAMIVAARIKNK